MKREKIDVDIYLDVDDTLFTIGPDGIFELRDGLIGFLYFLTNNFENCYWLTCWNDSFNDVLRLIYAGSIANKFKSSNWMQIDSNNKAKAIDFSRDFIWIEDKICNKEIDILKDHECLDKYWEVPGKGEMDYLYKVKQRLIDKFNIKSA